MWLFTYIHYRGKEENKKGVFERNESEEHEGQNPEWNSQVGGGRFWEGMGRLLKTVFRGEEYMAKLIFCHFIYFIIVYYNKNVF